MQALSYLFAGVGRGHLILNCIIKYAYFLALKPSCLLDVLIAGLYHFVKNGIGNWLLLLVDVKLL